MWPSLGLGITGSPGVVRQFEMDYGPATGLADGPPPGVEVSFGSRGRTSFDVVGTWRGRRKTTTWQVRLGSPASEILEAEIEVRGLFGLPLLQSLVVEPLLSVAFARRGEVLLPAAGIVQDEGVVILLGGPGAGKSSLAVRALVSGVLVLGDDHVIVDPDGLCRRFPRRLRLYPDLPRTSPTAYAKLSAARRAELSLREALRLLTRGAVRLPILVRASELDAGPLDGQWPVLPARRVVLLTRSVEIEQPVITSRSGVQLAGEAGLLLESDRATLAAGGPSWQEASAETGAAEQVILARAWESTRAEAITVPARWTARRVLDFLSAEVGLPR